MKKFNQMTEFQMSKTNGGFITAIVVGLSVLTGSLITLSATMAVENSKTK